MHLNWLIPLGGDLQGQLPYPELTAQAMLKAQVFGRRVAVGPGLVATPTAVVAPGLMAFLAAHG